MASGVAFGLTIALGAALASVVAGRNLTRSIAAGAISIGGLGVALTSAGAGFVGFFVLIMAALVLTTIQLFGWMLVDVDRDHLPPTDRATWIARSLAFLLLGGGLALLVILGIERGALTPYVSVMDMATPAQIGALFFGPWRDLSTLCGVALAAGLLATLMLLRDDGEYR
jgi:hypothetical protein